MGGSPNGLKPKSLDQPRRPFAVSRAAHHEDGVQMTKIVNHRGEGEMPRGQEAGAGAVQDSPEVLAAQDKKPACAMPRAQKRGP